MNEMQAKNYLLFRVASVDFAAAFEDVIRILPKPDITPAPNFPSYMSGTAVIEGQVVPVINAAKRFGFKEEESERPCLILTRLDGESELSKRYPNCAVLVDEVCSTVSTSKELQPPPSINKASFSRYLSGTLFEDGRTIYVISPCKLTLDKE